jgi:hypothetical protein
MRRALIVNGVIVALALGTLGVVWATRDAPTTGELLARKHKLLGVWDKAGVSRIRLSRGGRQLELVRDASAGVEGDFRIVKPWQERADIATVNALLGSLDLATSLRSAEGVDRKLAGLTQPLLEISLEMSGTTHVLRLGALAPSHAGARYLETTSGGEPPRIVLVSAGLVAELDVPFEKLREPRLLSVEQRELASLTITHATGKVEVVQARPAADPSGTTFFVQRSGGRELANRDALFRILTALSRLVTPQFVEPEQARALIAKDVTSIRVKLELIAKAGLPITLSLGGACPSAVEQRLVLKETPQEAPRAGCMPADIVEALRAVERDVVLETPFAARVDEVKSIHISSERHVKEARHRLTRLDLARKDVGFTMSSPADAEVSLEAGNERIEAVVRARTTRPSTPVAGEELWQDGWIRVDVLSHDGSVDSEEVRLGKLRPDGSRCLKRQLDDVVLCIDAETAKAFLPDPTLLRGSTVTSFAAADVKQLSIEAPNLRQSVLRTDDGSFTLQEPEGFAHDGALVTDVVQALGSLRAERWAAPSQRAEHGLERPRLRVRVTLVAPGIVHELLVGAATSGGYFARLYEDPGVFVLARSTVDALEAPLIDRSLSPVTPEKLAQIELKRGARVVKLVKTGDTFESPDLPAARAAALAETLRSLRADFTVHLGPERASEQLRPASATITFTASTGERHTLRIGARDTIEGARIAFARIDSVNATFALAASTVAALQDF